MELNAKQAYAVLKFRGVEWLHHANSVQTSCSFLRTGFLMARGVVERKGFRQTTQSSDMVDRKYGIWFDVFTDSVDIHERAHRRNLYGPVLFKIKFEILDHPNMPPIWITKKNPANWIDGESIANRWYTSIDELSAGFSKGQFDQMIVFRHIGGLLPIKGYVEDIILDDPNQEYYGLKFYDLSAGALFAAAMESGIFIRIFKRECSMHCTCQAGYAANLDIALKYFFP